MASVVEIDPLGPWKRWRLSNEQASVDVLPGRGGLVTSFRVGPEELLFLDASTVLDATKSVRGGVPILWPIAGRLEGDRYESSGCEYRLKQHGFARNRPWDVLSSGVDEASPYLTLVQRDDAETRAVFPWPFELRYTVRLLGAELRMTLEAENRGDAPMPHAPGFHPYFAIPDASKAKLRVETDATWGLDNRSGKPYALGEIDFTVEELDLHLQDHFLPGTLLRRPEARPVRLGWNDGFEALVLWTLRGRDFVCVEPWAAQAGAFPSGEGVRTVPPGEADGVSWSISI